MCLKKIGPVHSIKIPATTGSNFTPINCFALFPVGLKDVDCEDNQLCCFDGCINACYMAGRGKKNKLENIFCP